MSLWIIAYVTLLFAADMRADASSAINQPTNAAAFDHDQVASASIPKQGHQRGLRSTRKLSDVLTCDCDCADVIAGDVIGCSLGCGTVCFSDGDYTDAPPNDYEPMGPGVPPFDYEPSPPDFPLGDYEPSPPDFPADDYEPSPPDLEGPPSPPDAAGDDSDSLPSPPTATPAPPPTATKDVRPPPPKLFSSPIVPSSAGTLICSVWLAAIAILLTLS